jgi:hypothetical protein
MNSSQPADHLKFSTPATYIIAVKGFLDESWSERLGGMQITSKVPDNGAPITKLSGKVRDQTELIGMINSLYEMRMPLVSLKIVDNVNKANKL